MVLETQRLTLRELTQDDYDALCRILKDEKVMVAYEGGLFGRGGSAVAGQAA